MDIEEKREKLAHMQKYFVKSFWLSFVLLILASVLCIVFYDSQLAMVSKYFHMKTEDYAEAVVLVFGIWKVLIIQFTLVPALVLTCMKRCCFKNECKL